MRLAGDKQGCAFLSAEKLSHSNRVRNALASANRIRDRRVERERHERSPMSLSQSRITTKRFRSSSSRSFTQDSRRRLDRANRPTAWWCLSGQELDKEREEAEGAACFSSSPQ